MKRKLDATAAMQVRVVVRVRPLLAHETHNQQQRHHCVRVTHAERAGAPSTVELHLDSSSSSRNQESPRAFSFSNCYDGLTPQRVFFEREIAPSIPLVLAGGNAMVLALGASGSGKTLTMEGSTKKDTGMVPRCVQRLFELVERSHSAFSLSASYFEISHGRIFDLLVPRTQQTDLALCEDTDGTLSVSGLTHTRIETVRDFDSLYARGRASRRTTRTALNANASRSHSVVLVHVATTDNATSARRSGTLHLVDLAGSDDLQSLAGSTGSRSHTSVLESIFPARSSESQSIAAHEQKLTRVLQSATRTNSSTVLLCHIAPLAQTLDATLETLTFASKASGHSHDHDRSDATSDTNTTSVQATTATAPKTSARATAAVTPRASSASATTTPATKTRQPVRTTPAVAPHSDRPSSTPVRTARLPSSRSAVTPAPQSVTRAIDAKRTPGSMESKLAAWRAAKLQSKLSQSTDVRASHSSSSVGRKRPAAAVASVSAPKRTPPAPAMRPTTVARTSPTTVHSRSLTTATRPSTTSSVVSATTANAVQRRESVAQESPRVRLQASDAAEKRQLTEPPSRTRTSVASAPPAVRATAARSVPSPPMPSPATADTDRDAQSARLQTRNDAASLAASCASHAPAASVAKPFAPASSSATYPLTTAPVQVHSPVVPVTSAAPVCTLLPKPQEVAAPPPPLQRPGVQESLTPESAPPVRDDPVRLVASVASSPSLRPAIDNCAGPSAPLTNSVSVSTLESAPSASTSPALASSAPTSNDIVPTALAPTQAPSPASADPVRESSTMPVRSASPPLTSPVPKPRVAVGSPAHDKENVSASAANSARRDAPAALVAKQLIALALERERKRRFRTALSLLERASQMLPTANAKLDARMALLARACPLDGAAPPQHLTTAAFVQRVLEQDLLAVLNSGSVDELLELHAIGDKRAEKIVAARPFHQVRSLIVGLRLTYKQTD